MLRKALYAQAALVVESDDGGFVASITPAADIFRAETAGAEIEFMVNMSATSASSTGGGEVTLSFQGHKVSGGMRGWEDDNIFFGYWYECSCSSMTCFERIQTDRAFAC